MMRSPRTPAVSGGAIAGVPAALAEEAEHVALDRNGSGRCRR